MYFKKIVFDNYKTYYGHQEISFEIPAEATEQGKNIILIGGLNGSGKTTIIKAILYVLFNKRGIPEEEYQRSFSNVINNTYFEEGGRESSVTLTIVTDNGEDWEIKVHWSINQYKQLINENRNITIRKAGVRYGRNVRIDNLEAYNRLIDRIIPYHAAPFFIYDGEEIKDIILRQNSNEMKDAIHKITGIHSFNQLLNDLINVQNNLERRLAKAVNSSDLKNLQDQLEQSELEIEKAKKNIEKLKNNIFEKERAIKKITDERNKKLLQNSISRETIIKKQMKVKIQFDHVKNDLDNLFHKHSLNIILKNKIQALKNRLIQEKNNRDKRIVHEASITPYFNFINKLLSEPITPPLSSSQLEQIKNIGENIWMNENNINRLTDNVEEIHDISNIDYSFIQSISPKDVTSIKKMVNLKDRYTNELIAIEEKLKNAPKYLDIEEENYKIDILTKKLGEYNLRLRTISRKLNKINEDRSKLLNQLTRLTQQSKSFEAIKNKLSYVTKLIQVTKMYTEELTTMKAKFIQNEFSNMLTSLFRKKDEFGKIEFDIDSYSIRLYNDRNQEISIQERSAGEMQMISSALIWALTKASDLSLPMVIDTPLGRLDSYHRNHLVNHYYQNLSKQVIILSTDTEITEEYINIMKESSYKQYMLDYIEEKKYTIIRDGYFDFIGV